MGLGRCDDPPVLSPAKIANSILLPSALTVALAVAQTLAMSAVAPSAHARKPNSSGKLVVMSTTSGADIFIDGKRAGSVPRERPFNMSVGKHTLRLELRGYNPIEKEIDIQPGKKLEIEVDLLAFAGVLLVETPGVTAEVVVDGQPLGPTPFDGDVTVGSRSIEIRASGYKSYKAQLIIKGGQLYPLNVDLEIDPTEPFVVARPNEPAEADDGADGFSLGLPEGWYTEPWVIIGAGAAVVVAIGAAVLLSADEEAPAGPTPEQTLTVGAGYP